MICIASQSNLTNKCLAQRNSVLNVESDQDSYSLSKKELDFSRIHYKIDHKDIKSKPAQEAAVGSSFFLINLTLLICKLQKRRKCKSKPILETYSYH